MDVIAGRKTQGEIRGDLLVNGYPKEQRSWSRVVGYVEQNDIHSPQARMCCAPVIAIAAVCVPVLPTTGGVPHNTGM